MMPVTLDYIFRTYEPQSEEADEFRETLEPTIEGPLSEFFNTVANKIGIQLGDEPFPFLLFAKLYIEFKLASHRWKEPKWGSVKIPGMYYSKRRADLYSDILYSEANDAIRRAGDSLIRDSLRYLGEDSGIDRSGEKQMLIDAHLDDAIFYGLNDCRALALFGLASLQAIGTHIEFDTKSLNESTNLPSFNELNRAANLSLHDGTQFLLNEQILEDGKFWGLAETTQLLHAQGEADKRVRLDTSPFAHLLRNLKGLPPVPEP